MASQEAALQLDSRYYLQITIGFNEDTAFQRAEYERKQKCAEEEIFKFDISSDFSDPILVRIGSYIEEHFSSLNNVEGSPPIFYYVFYEADANPPESQVENISLTTYVLTTLSFEKNVNRVLKAKPEKYLGSFYRCI